MFSSTSQYKTIPKKSVFLNSLLSDRWIVSVEMKLTCALLSSACRRSRHVQQRLHLRWRHQDRPGVVGLLSHGRTHTDSWVCGSHGLHRHDHEAHGISRHEQNEEKRWYLVSEYDTPYHHTHYNSIQCSTVFLSRHTWEGLSATCGWSWVSSLCSLGSSYHNAGRCCVS